MEHPLPDHTILYEALVNKDTRFEGIFTVGVKTTGIFCRPTCTARKPKTENVEFFQTPREALLNGYRPCKLCHPLEKTGETPAWLRSLLKEITANPELRITDSDLRQRGYEPQKVRRWFKKNHGMTFQGYMRALRINKAFSELQNGAKVIDVALDAGYDSLSGFTEYFKKTTGDSPGRSRQKNIVTLARLTTPLGPMLAGATDDGICLLEFVDRRMIETQMARIEKYLKADIIPGTHPLLDRLQIELSEYFTGDRQRFDLPLVAPGTPFQKQVWDELLTIPYGQTRSYQDQAVRIGNPRAIRAVARANGDNRIAIIIPCHRVIGKDGNLTGYGGGLWRKKFLLELESSQRVMCF